jgi:DeoR/GlpR family transcriptional regulator of sugar metabolism
VKIIATGGRVHTTCLAFVGDDAFKTVEQYNADVCFFACRGLSEDGKLTDIAPDEDYVRLKMMEHSERSYLLCTAEKIGKVYYHNICHLDRISGVVFGEEPCEKLKKYRTI